MSLSMESKYYFQLNSKWRPWEQQPNWALLYQKLRNKFDTIEWARRDLTRCYSKNLTVFFIEFLSSKQRSYLLFIHVLRPHNEQSHLLGQAAMNCLNIGRLNRLRINLIFKKQFLLNISIFGSYNSSLERKNYAL